MIQSAIRMVLPGNRLKEATAILGPMAERTRTERGCLGCHLHQDVLDENVLIFEESWASDTDMERHLRSQEYRDLLLVMEMALVKPEVRFDTVARSSGIETIHHARG
ncbi:MAG TPA: antibiotic biosynthesis monooxygenase family protein [archaeon]|nr:antibiotic biosynthesis monooxygenase family protein [archaeon]